MTVVGGPPGPAGTVGAGSFALPPYPYDRVAELARLAEGLPGGVVDCSIGTPCDAPPLAVIEALALSGSERGYPSSAGSTAFRRAAADWIERRFGVAVDTASVAACVGTKELVASTAQYLKLRDGRRDTVLYPTLSYPTYAMGALLAGCRAIGVPPLTPDGAGLDLAAVDPADAERALALWVNSPANPTGALTDLGQVAEWGRARGIPVLSDECYCEFTWEGPPRTVLEHGLEGVLAVHSLSKRSNLAGVRAGFYAGDPQLVAYLREVRRHAGLMVPGPVQAAAAVAFADDEHVALQRRRYWERLTFLAEQLAAVGCPVTLPAGGFYLWAPTPSRWPDPWAFAEDLAKTAGLLVSPGDLYGEVAGGTSLTDRAEVPGDGSATGHVRMAVVQPMVRLRLVAERLESAGWGRAR